VGLNIDKEEPALKMKLNSKISSLLIYYKLKINLRLRIEFENRN